MVRAAPRGRQLRRQSFRKDQRTALEELMRQGYWDKPTALER